MKKYSINIIGSGLFLLILIFALQIFLPRRYSVPHLLIRESTKYWNLSTGSRIAYTLIEARTTRRPFPVIYLHGGPGGSISDKTISSLAALADEGYDVYLYDQIGSGLSDRLKDINEYTADRHKKDLEEIIKKTGAEKVILIGQSWGAMLSLLVVSDNADKIEKIIFTGPGPVFPVHTQLAQLKTPDSLQLTHPYYSNVEGNRASTNIRARAMEFFAIRFGWKLASDKEADDFAAYRNAMVNRSTVCDTAKIPEMHGGSGFYSQVMTMKTIYDISDPRPRLANSKIPVLIMKGQCDNQPWGFVTEYLALFPQHQLCIIPNAGHFIFLEQPELYLKTIRAFLNK